MKVLNRTHYIIISWFKYKIEVAGCRSCWVDTGATFFWLNDVLWENSEHHHQNNVCWLNEVLQGISGHQQVFCIISKSRIKRDAFHTFNFHWRKVSKKVIIPVNILHFWVPIILTCRLYDLINLNKPKMLPCSPTNWNYVALLPVSTCCYFHPWLPIHLQSPPEISNRMRKKYYS